MTRITCTCCGDEMEVYLNEGLAVCESCGSTQMLPKVNDEERVSLMNQADELRRKCSFDAAIAMYSSIISKFPNEAVAYFRLALSEYGIEYVKDVDGKYIPTFHRMSYDSVLENRNIKLAIEKAGPIDMLEYRKQIQELERVRQGILEKVSQAKSYDVFISFKQHTGLNASTVTFDYDFGNRLYQDLTEEGYQVFFSPVTLQYVAGEEYEPAIFAALNSAKVMILLSSNREYTDSKDGENSQAVWVENEWTRFLELEKKDTSKKLIPCFYGTPDTLPAKLVSRQGVDMSRGSAAQRLLTQVGRILPRQKAQPAQQSVQTSGGNGGYGISESTLLARVRQMLLDREFSEAKSKCEQILDANSSCAEAYMSRALIARKECSLLTMKESLVGAVSDSREKQYQVFVSDQDLQKLIREYEVSNYLTARDIQNELPTPECYTSCYDYMVENRESVVDAFFHDRDVVRAYSNASESYEQTLKDFKEEIYDEVEQIIAREKAKQERKRTIAFSNFQFAQKKATEKLKKLSQEAKQQREADYQKACQVKSEDDVQEGRRLLQKVGDYKNALEKKRDLDSIASTLEQVGDGSDYLCQCLAKSEPEKLKEYVESSVMTRTKYTGKKWEWLLLLWLAGIVLSVRSIDLSWLVGGLLLVASFVVSVYLCRQGKVKLVKPVFTVLFIVANVLMRSYFAVILTAFCMRRNGVLNYLLSKWMAKQDLKLRKKDFITFETATRERLESEWQRVLGHSFTKPLTSIADTLSAAEKGDIVQWYNNLIGRKEEQINTKSNDNATTSTTVVVWITSVPVNQKVKVIKALREQTGWDLAKTKTFIDDIMTGQPKRIQVDSVQSAQELANILQQAGASVTMESITKSATIA